jgi:hypothetical protein
VHYLQKKGHLRNACPGRINEEQSGETMLDLSSRMDSPVAPTHLSYPDLPTNEDSAVLDSLTGKLKLICPSLYNSLTNWELEHLNYATMVASGPPPPQVAPVVPTPRSASRPTSTQLYPCRPLEPPIQSNSSPPIPTTFSAQPSLLLDPRSLLPSTLPMVLPLPTPPGRLFWNLPLTYI